MLLPQQEAKLFFKLYLHLLGYVNSYDGNNIKRELVEARKILYANPNILIDFIRENLQNFKENELRYLREWLKYIKGDFILVRDLKQHSVLLSTGGKRDCLYGVLGLNDPIIDVALHGVGTYFSELILLPWEDKIIWDGLSYQKPLILGHNFMNEIKELYMTANKNGKIICTIE